MLTSRRWLNMPRCLQPWAQQLHSFLFADDSALVARACSRLAIARLCGLDVLVEPKHIARVVLFLDLNEANLKLSEGGDWDRNGGFRRTRREVVPKAAFGESVAARHVCQNSLFQPPPTVLKTRRLGQFGYLDIWQCAEIYSFCAEGLCRGRQRDFINLECLVFHSAFGFVAPD